MNKKLEKQLRVLVKKVNQSPTVETIENTLEAKQDLVGGLIEVVPFDDVLLICNEEGKILNMNPNIILDNNDYIAGDCFFIGDDYNNADFKSLTDEEIEKLKIELRKRSFEYLDYEEREI